MLTVMVEKNADETSSGAYPLKDDYKSAEEAHREAAAARIAYPNGAAWVEDKNGNVVPKPE